MKIPALNHCIRKESIEVEVDCEEIAFALEPRLSEANRRSFLPVIERVLDEFVQAGRHVRVARIEVDLGSMRFENFEQVATERLYTALSEALNGAICELNERPTLESYSQPEQTARLSLLEHYLMTGVLPFWAQLASRFSLEEFIVEIAGNDPAGLVAIIRKCGRHEHALKRIVLQLGEAAIRDLIRLLDPSDAQLIIVYIIDLQELNRTRSLPSMTEKEFTRTLWFLVFAYLIYDAGSQFNRKSFVRSLLEGIAESEALDYSRLVAAFALGLERTGRTRSLKSSLPAVIRELVSELQRDERFKDIHQDLWGAATRGLLEFESYDRLQAADYYLKYGVLPWSALTRDPGLTAEGVLSSLSALPRPLLTAALCRPNPDTQLETTLRLVSSLSEERVPDLLRALMPEANHPGSRFWPAVASFAATAEDSNAFYARLIAGILKGEPLDVEEFASAPLTIIGGSPLPGAPTDWELHTLKSVIASRMRFGNHSDKDEQTLADLLHALTVRHPEEARHFFRAIRNTHILQSGLSRLCEPALFLELMALLRPGETGTLNAFISSLARIPSQYKPASDERVRRIIFLEMVRMDEDRMLSVGFFLGVLKELFATPLPNVVFKTLIEEADSWSRDDTVPESHATALAVATKMAGARTNGAAGPDETPENAGKWSIQAASNLRAAVTALLSGERPARPEAPEAGFLSTDALLHELHLMLDESPEELKSLVSRDSIDPDIRERWVETLPESILVRIVHLLEPRKSRLLIKAAELLMTALQDEIPSLASQPIRNKILWGFLLEFLSSNTEAARSIERLIVAFLEYSTIHYSQRLLAPSDRRALNTRLLERAQRLAERSGDSTFVVALGRGQSLLTVVRRPPGSTRPSDDDRRSKNQSNRRQRRSITTRVIRGKTAFNMVTEESISGGDPIYIENAGLVLASPFLSQLFETLGMIESTENKTSRFRDDKTARRAVHLLQFLVDRATATPEPLLVLNKILCGVPIAAPVESEIVLAVKEQEACELLLKSMIANWTPVQNTSIDGLQETFLQREGRLDHRPEGWRLTVNRKTLDVLVDQVPWSISVILNEWMPQPLYVTW